jgi:hypothetical protein
VGPPPNEVRPQANLKAQVTTGQEVDASLSQPTPTTADLVYPIVAMIHELRSDLPLSVVASLVVETLDLSSCLHLDGQWAEARQAAWPEAIRLAHNRHLAPYGVRRVEEWANVPAKPGDHMGRPDRGEVA